jgi:hypothetical protein
MKKVIFASFLLSIIMIFGSHAMAKNVAGALPVPTNMNCVLDDTTGDVTDDSICFNWDAVVVGDKDVPKYSVDIEVPVDVDGDGFEDMIVELSFGTSDRTDGLPMSDPNLCVPLSELVYDYDVDGNDIIDEIEQGIPLTGTASAKVKALDPGKGKGRQNNTFSLPCSFDLP